MKAKKIIAFCLIIILSTTCVFAYTDTQLQGMLELNNISLSKAKNTAELAGLDSKDSRASFQPTVDFTATCTYMQNPPVGKITVDTDDIISSVTGISGMGYGPYTIYKGMENSLYNFDVKITQPIFTWGKLSTAVSIYDNVELVRNLQVKSLRKQLSCELRARESGIYYIKKMMANLQKQDSISKRLVEISKDAQINGIFTKQDVLEAQVKAKKVDVGLKQLNMELNKQLTAIRTLVGNQKILSSDIEFVPNEDLMKQIVDSDWNALLAKALSPTRETFSILSLLEDVSSKTKYVAANSLYWKPDLGLQVELGYYGSSFPLLQTGYNTTDNYQLNVTLALKDTLWDGGKALNEVSRKIIDQKDASLDTNDARNQIAQKLNEALVQMDYSTSNIEFKNLSESVVDEKIKQDQSKLDEGYGDETAILFDKIEKYGYELEALEEMITRASNYYTVEFLIGDN